MHGLILAGGIGSRLAADGVAEPKPLVRIGGRPQLLRLCETLEGLGCESVTCMTRAGVSAASIVGDDPRRRIISCSTASSLHTLALGFGAMPPGPVFCSMVDTVMPWESWLPVWDAWQAAVAEAVPVVLAVAPCSERDESPLLVRIDESGRITALGASLPGESFATAGVYGFGPSVRPLALRALNGGVQRMRGFLTLLASDGLHLRAVPVHRALDIDRREDLDEANLWAPMVGP
ncbi:MAG: NTP transferase domain-containing protein [Gemmatimonadales bacterium]